MLTASNLDHQFFNGLVDVLSATGMVFGLVVLYLCVTYPTRRKR